MTRPECATLYDRALARLYNILMDPHELAEPTHSARRKVHRTLRLSPHLAAALDDLAAARGVSESGLARQALALGLYTLLGGSVADLPRGLASVVTK